MLKALVAVDGSDDSLGAVRHVIKLVAQREPLEIHLLDVQPPLHGDVTMFVSGMDPEIPVTLVKRGARAWPEEQRP